MKKTHLIAILLVVSSQAVAAEVVHERIGTEYQPIRVVKIAGGLNHPWAFAFLPDDRLLVSERPGTLKLIASGEAAEVSGVPAVAAFGQGGLLDVALHPAFADNGLVYFTYSRANPDDDSVTATTLARGRLDGTALKDVETLFTQDRFSAPGRHYGSRLVWLADGTLLMSIGDRGAEPPRAQDLGDHAGTLLRLTEDGGVPDDNPFTGRDDALPEIYSYGHRNIQGLIVHPETGQIWATEHGPRGGDELNRIEAGSNYGWPQVSRGVNYRTQEPYFDYTERSQEGMVDPVIDWTPSLAASGLAVLPQDTVFADQWSGNFLAGSLRAEQVRRIVFRDGEPVHEEELIRGVLGRIRDVRIGPDGLIYVATDNGDGDDGIYRLEPAG